MFLIIKLKENNVFLFLLYLFFYFSIYLYYLCAHTNKINNMVCKSLYRVWGAFFLLFLVLLSSCGSIKDVVYFQNVKDKYDLSSDSFKHEVRIANNDNLLITVATKNPQAASLFNTVKMEGSSVSQNLQWFGYLVDSFGNINFPLIGTIQLAGLTKQEAINLLQKRISEYVEDPVVNIRFMNYKISVIGEVNKPGDFIANDEKVTLIQALALAGDMTIYGNRRNVLVYRESENLKQAHRVDMTSLDVFGSPVYYLQQNDVVYVEPNKAKARSSTNYIQNTSLGVSLVSIALTIALFFRK